MATSEEKVSKFVQAITAYAKEQREKILREAEEFTAERLQKAEQEVLIDAHRLIQQETAEIRSEGVREMSRRDLEARRDVLSRRRQIMDEVFARAGERLEAYAASPEYADGLRDMLAGMLEEFPADGTVYEIARRDEKLAEGLRALCPPGSRVECADDIRIGGIRGIHAKSGRLADNTLDARLPAQRDWFVLHSGLAME